MQSSDSQEKEVVADKKDVIEKSCDQDEIAIQKFDDELDKMTKARFGPKFDDWLSMADKNKTRKMAEKVNGGKKTNPSEIPN